MSTPLNSLAELPCGCALRDGGWRFCPLHAQAEAMRDFVHGVIVWAMHVSAGGEVDWSQMRDRARALLRATEGREPP